MANILAVQYKKQDAGANMLALKMDMDMRSVDELDVQMAREETQHWISVADAETTRALILENALRGLFGLIQLVTRRDDCPTAIKESLTTGHRWEAARVEIAASDRRNADKKADK